MFDLQTGVHLKKVEILGSVHDEFNGTRTGIANGLGQCDRLFTHRLTGGFIEEWAWGLFDHFLVPALDRTFAFAQIDAVAMGITQHLNFDVTRLGNEFLNKNAIVAKGIRRLVL